MRSERLRIADFLGRPLTLADGPEAWETLMPQGEDLLLLGLGPGRGPFLAAYKTQKLYWLEAPSMLAAMHGYQGLPDIWTKVTEEQALRLFSTCRVLFFRQNDFLAPQFWSSFLGRSFSQRWQKTPAPAVYLPGDSTTLLHRELVWACSKLGLGPIVQCLSGENEESLELAFAGHPPAFCLSVNGRGLDVRGRLFALFKALHVPCAMWIVDNPWHVLSRFKLPWWKEANLFVTDPSFIPALSSEGVKHVNYLPLACAPHMWRPLRDADHYASTDNLLFVGRSAFPAKERFFAAVRLPQHLMDQSKALLATGPAPDIHWWYRQCATVFWPGSDARIAGAGAEQCSQEKRVQWLEAAIALGCEVVGDQWWQKLLPQSRPMPPVDYYGSLPDLYAQALGVLNVTSLQLPQSLNQRHFDVWAAGGLLITDKTPGLELFPAELTSEIALDNPSQLSGLLSRIRQERHHFHQIRMAWRECLANAHSYPIRLKSLISYLS